jgi:hypothetical protein
MDTADIAALRANLEANNGIKGLDILEPGDARHAVELFRRDGFVVIANALNSEQTEILARGCEAVIAEILALDQNRVGNRGSHRYSFGGSSLTRSQLHRPEWQMLLDLQVVTDVVTAIFESPDYVLRAASGRPALVRHSDGGGPAGADQAVWRNGLTAAVGLPQSLS